MQRPSSVFLLETTLRSPLFKAKLWAAISLSPAYLPYSKDHLRFSTGNRKRNQLLMCSVLLNRHALFFSLLIRHSARSCTPRGVTTAESQRFRMALQLPQLENQMYSSHLICRLLAVVLTSTNRLQSRIEFTSNRRFSSH